VLFIFCGLPGTGKSALAPELAHRLGAVYLRIDTIEYAIAPTEDTPIDETGYRVAYAVAEDNLRLGQSVVADSVNPVRLTQECWRNVAKRAGVSCVEIMVVCSDRAEHRRRIESRKIDIAGLRGPTWQDVLTRAFEPLDRQDIVLDTAGQSVEQSVAALQAALSVHRPV
jgi:predicted kinase